MLIGLDYGCFICLMLLLQGQFVVFFNVKVKECVEFLEEFIGIEIYGQIFVQVFEKYKLVCFELEKL